MKLRMMNVTKLPFGYCEIQILKFTRACITSFYVVGDVLFLICLRVQV